MFIYFKSHSVRFRYSKKRLDELKKLGEEPDKKLYPVIALDIKKESQHEDVKTQKKELTKKHDMPNTPIFDNDEEDDDEEVTTSLEIMKPWILIIRNGKYEWVTDEDVEIIAS